MMKDIMMDDIPKELIEYLAIQENRCITMSEGEIRRVNFYAPEDIKKKTFDVNSYELFLNGLLENDPDEIKEFVGYDLIQEVNDYDPEGILIWFIDLEMYGTWDCDHHRIFVFPNKSFLDIMTKPSIYINALWYPEKVENHELNPWLK